VRTRFNRLARPARLPPDRRVAAVVAYEVERADRRTAGPAAAAVGHRFPGLPPSLQRAAAALQVPRQRAGAVAATGRRAKCPLRQWA
jgi:hypothetical protein